MPRLTPPGRPQLGCTRAAADHLDQGVAVVPHLEHLAGHVHADLGHHAQDVPLGRRGVGTDDEVRPAQGVEVRRVVGGVEDAVEQLAELLGRRRRIDVEHARPGPWWPPGDGPRGRRRRSGPSGSACPRPAGPRRTARSRAAPGSASRRWPRRPASSRKMSILPWPSSRVMGSMEMRFIVELQVEVDSPCMRSRIAN